MKNQKLDMVRLKVVLNSEIIKIARDYAGRLYRIVNSDISIHKSDDEYFCFIQRRKGFFWKSIEIIAYEHYLNLINNQNGGFKGYENFSESK